MREIKFRAWDNEAELWRYFSLDEAIVGRMRFFEGKISRICEYTGLKDKNGEEIFEGDIVKCGGIQQTMEIKWHNSRWEEDWYHYAGFEFPIGEDKFEVIGNVYEHPNLLK